MKKAADTPTTSVVAEEIRGHLGRALDALAESAEREARRELAENIDGPAQDTVRALHSGRRR